MNCLPGYLNEIPNSKNVLCFVVRIPWKARMQRISYARWLSINLVQCNSSCNTAWYKLNGMKLSKGKQWLEIFNKTFHMLILWFVCYWINSRFESPWKSLWISWNKTIKEHVSLRLFEDASYLLQRDHYSRDNGVSHAQHHDSRFAFNSPWLSFQKGNLKQWKRIVVGIRQYENKVAL